MHELLLAFALQYVATEGCTASHFQGAERGKLVNVDRRSIWTLVESLDHLVSTFHKDWNEIMQNALVEGRVETFAGHAPVFI